MLLWLCALSCNNKGNVDTTGKFGSKHDELCSLACLTELDNGKPECKIVFDWPKECSGAQLIKELGELA